MAEEVMDGMEKEDGLVSMLCDIVPAYAETRLGWLIRNAIERIDADRTALTTAASKAAALKAENEALRKALEPFARYVDKRTCKITMIWQDGEYKSTYTDTLKPKDFFAARTALQEPDA